MGRMFLLRTLGRGGGVKQRVSFPSSSAGPRLPAVAAIALCNDYLNLKVTKCNNMSISVHVLRLITV
jgi:hypothetical protein